MREKEEGAKKKKTTYPIDLLGFVLGLSYSKQGERSKQLQFHVHRYTLLFLLFLINNEK